MKFSIPILSDNLGGTIWLRHIGETLAQLGHEVSYCSFGDNTSSSDYTIIQSEWIEKPAYLTSKRAIILLGHFTNVIYPDSTKLRYQDIVLTQWTGEVVEDWEARSGKMAHYFPHGYFKQKNDEVVPKYTGLWIGSDTPFRDTSRFGSDIVSINCDPILTDSFYSKALICPNVHLNIQKGSLVNVPESILEKPGYAVNERLFWIPGAGGFQIADENPLVREFYDEDEVPMATAEDFKEIFEYYLNHPEERKKMAEKAHERTLREHTYEHRIKSILLPLI